MINTEANSLIYKQQLSELFAENTTIPKSLGFEFWEAAKFFKNESWLPEEYWWCRLLEHKPWQEVDFFSISCENWQDLTFYYLSKEAFSYYLPAFLYNLSRQKVYDAEGSSVYSSFEMCLSEGSVTNKKFFSDPSSNQRLAIYKFLLIYFKMDKTSFDFWPEFKYWDLASEDICKESNNLG